MENSNQSTYLTIGVTAIAGVIGLLGWHTYNNSSYEEPSTNILSHEEKPEGLKENTEATNTTLNLKMSTPSILNSFWKSEYDTENIKAAMESE